MSNFRKKKDCPSSFELLDALDASIDGELALRLAPHLSVCEFCSAELAFYRAYRPDYCEEPVPEIPARLFQLAEAIIGRETIHISQLEYLLREAA